MLEHLNHLVVELVLFVVEELKLVLAFLKLVFYQKQTFLKLLMVEMRNFYLILHQIKLQQL